MASQISRVESSEIEFLDETEMADALQSLLADPYGNAPLIADLAVRTDEADFACVRNPLALLSYHRMPSFPNIAVHCHDVELFQKMLGEMADRHPELRDGITWCLASGQVLDLLQKSVEVQSVQEELQMRLEFGSYRTSADNGAGPKVVALTTDHAPDLTALYRIVPPEVWREEDLRQGPYRGVYEDGKLVATAGVHWLSPWMAEIGNIAAHPDSRRKGLAEACVRSVIEELRAHTERIYLMVFADNEPAIGLYRKLGFEVVQRMWLVGFRLLDNRGYI